MNNYTLELIEKRLKNQLISELTRVGLLFRLFSRVKDSYSVDEKFARKLYAPNTKKMQDLVGFRITTYFSDDVGIAVELCKRLFEVIEVVYDEPNSEVFKPLRKNMICRIPKDEDALFMDLKKTNPDLELIDNTFEIQFRTTLSEGWHEVDHLMRYKCKEDWDSLTDESRMLNGIYASLEVNDAALKALFDDISYHHYKAKRWEAMLRNKLRLRFSLTHLDDDIISYLNKSHIGRHIFKLNRTQVISDYLNSTLTFPTTFNNWMFFINYLYLKDEYILSKTPDFILDELKLAFSESLNVVN